MEKFITNIEDLPLQQQNSIKKRLQELRKSANTILKDSPTLFPRYYKDAIKECEDSMLKMVAESSRIGAVLDNISYIYVIHKERKKDLEQLNEEYLSGQQQPQSLNPEPQPRASTPTKKGRPKETLKDKMTDDVDGLKLQKIHKVIKGKKGKDAALIILASIKKGWMSKPTFTQVKNEFGDIGVQQGFTKYLNEGCFDKNELEGAIKSLS